MLALLQGHTVSVLAGLSCWQRCLHKQWLAKQLRRVACRGLFALVAMPAPGLLVLTLYIKVWVRHDLQSLLLHCLCLM